MLAIRNLHNWVIQELLLVDLAKTRENRYTGYIRYTGICSDTGIGDMYNSKIPIYRTLGISQRDTVCRIQTLLQVKTALSIITFIIKKTKFIITDGTI